MRGFLGFSQESMGQLRVGDGVAAGPSDPVSPGHSSLPSPRARHELMAELRGAPPSLLIFLFVRCGCKHGTQKYTHNVQDSSRLLPPLEPQCPSVLDAALQLPALCF